MDTNIRFAIQQSRSLSFMLFVTHFLAFTAVFFINCAGWNKLLFFIAIMFSFYYWHRLKITFVQCIKQGEEWILIDKTGESHTATLQDNSLITTFLIILNFKLSNKSKKSLVLFRDSLPPDLFRRLRVVLSL